MLFLPSCWFCPISFIHSIVVHYFCTSSLSLAIDLKKYWTRLQSENGFSDNEVRSSIFATAWFGCQQKQWFWRQQKTCFRSLSRFFQYVSDKLFKLLLFSLGILSSQLVPGMFQAIWSTKEHPASDKNHQLHADDNAVNKLLPVLSK